MSVEKTEVPNSETQKKNTVLGDFELKKKLGQGGMGAVYLAHQISLDRDCALKVMAKELAAKPGFVERFVREARSMAKIDHPNVVRCYAVDQDKGLNFVAMELIDGRSMQDWLNQQKQLSVADALLVTIMIGEALHYAHELNMIHRDVKPDNILVTKKGMVKLSDLGLAKAVDETELSLTQSGAGLGTPHYMAPEQARNAKHVDRRCDVYALGCTLYHFLTGKTPFAGGSLVELITNKEKGQFTAAHRVVPGIPERLSLMIDKAMAHDLKSRYQTCEEFINDLESLGLAGESLSFIAEDQRTAIRRRSSPSMVTGTGMGNRTMPIPARGAQTPAAAPAPKATKTPGTSLPGADVQWFVRYEENGKVKVAQMAVPAIMQSMKSDRFNEKAQASQHAKGPFIPLAQIPVFESEARKMLARRHSNARDTNLAAQYEKLAKQYDRRWIWHSLRRMMDGTLGIVGLMIWLAVIVAVGAGLYFAVPYVYGLLADKVGLDAARPR
ncbi:serine/threonine-protein kinase [Planctomicrobium sp. SH661]|uniref:serine/threonine-protein kinase n=1 Tax=Planctomicrobium sp. SH661 TaxID=3448124 RepID=UPI003F5AFEF5